MESAMRQKSDWFEAVTSALIRGRFATAGAPIEGYMVQSWTLRGKSGLVIVEISKNHNLRKVLPDGRTFVYPNCSIGEARMVIQVAALDSDFL
jgi:hypothetical protein